MSWWNAEEKLEPAPIEPEPPVDRLGEAHAAMALEKSALDIVADELKEFRRKYAIVEDRYGRIRACTLPPGISRREVDLLRQQIEKKLARSLHNFSRQQKRWNDAREAHIEKQLGVS